MKRSRLSRRMEKENRKNIIFSVLGILVVLFLLAKFGLPLLVDFSLLVTNNKTQKASTQKPNFISPPVLNPLQSATNSANINVSGVAGEKQIIELYINDELIGKTEAEKDGSFEFKEVKLAGKDNYLKAKATFENAESDFSKSFFVSFKETNPNLSLDSPKEDQSFTSDSNPIEVKGKTDSGIKVTVNDFWAIVDENGNFSYILTLKEGENKIEVTVVDEAGNKTEKEVKVNYSP